MQQDELKILLEKDIDVHSSNIAAKNLLPALDEIILSLTDKISQDVFSVYKKFVVMKQDAPDVMKQELFSAIKNFIREKIQNLQYPDALLLLRFLLVKSEMQAGSYYDTAQCLTDSGFSECGLAFLEIYEKKETNKPLKYLALANFYNLQLKDYKSAINYYEKYIKIDETKAVVYTILASLYSKMYGDISLKDQIFYFEKAYKLKPDDRLTLHGLAFAYERLGDILNAGRYYGKLIQNKPTETDYYNYGAFLISCGDFETGHKYFAHRFNIDDNNLKYPCDISKHWDMKSDIKEKTLLVHYEQGFGDTFMYCRFVPLLKPLAKKILFVVQDNLCELLKYSNIISDGIEIIPESSGVKSSDYDCSIALLDTPLAVNANSDNLPFANGYLDVPDELVKAYANKYIKKSNNLKVGIAYSGDRTANYNGRDIDICWFKSFLDIDGIDFYSLQAQETETPDGITPLGKTFNNFTDTACAAKNMDIIISTDNVILNLAGALGVKTFGLFNFYTNYRWFKFDNDTGWYTSVKPFKTEENNRWSVVFGKVKTELNKQLENRCSKL